jgi:hypothetical protein
LIWSKGLESVPGRAALEQLTLRFLLGALCYISLNCMVCTCRRFDPGRSLDRRVNCRCVSQPRWVGARRNTRGENSKGKLRPSCCPAPRVDALTVGGYKRSRGRERERVRALCVGPFSRVATFSYESPGPSFYRCKERA